MEEMNILVEYQALYYPFSPLYYLGMIGEYQKLLFYFYCSLSPPIIRDPYNFILFSQICFSRLLLVSELKDRWSGFTYAERTRLAGSLNL